MDARLYHEPPPPIPGKRGRKPLKGKRIESFKSMVSNKDLVWQEVIVNWYGGAKKVVHYLSGVDLVYQPNHPVAKIRWVLVKDQQGKLLSIPLFLTNTHHKPEFIIETFVKRFSIEVLFEEARAHLGMETQRQWNDKAIVRSTPLILALFSIVCLIDLRLRESVAFSVQSSAWYSKTVDEATFSDIIAYVRRYCWAERYFVNSAENNDMTKFTLHDFDSLINRVASSP